ncbi:Ig-like domain repeat protein [Nocardioides daphniae]|uniref:Bacterial Ig-like domain-containing protein n=1 Tax=Nocardioides daphniae TaxID=402297 RepID=A0A4P7UCF6_9ACTN|nr:Ig-like domain repeat protein [Nocardioides daphniae]QCC77892.1 hypothetical protein E2C04_13135 [Nocardioides daphniae]GGD27364.1 hypothetical protein GCM10007231_28500 [Nocardioides daphniae]
MKSLMRTARRGAAAGISGVLVAGVLAGLAAAPANAAPARGLSWNVSDQFQTHLNTQTPLGAATYDATTKDATFPLESVTTAGAVTTYTFDGGLKGAFAFGGTELYSIHLNDPKLVVEADGSGELRATVNSVGSNTDATVVFPSAGPREVTVTEFAASTKAGGVLTATPRWEGVLAPDSTEANDLGIAAGYPTLGKSFDPELLGALHPDVRSTFYWSNRGSAESNARKAPSTLVVDAQPTPAVKLTTTLNSPKEGVQVKVEGKGFTPVTNPGDDGVYVVMAPANEKIDRSDSSGIDKYPAAYVPAAAFNGNDFVTVVSANPAELKKHTQYAIFTWQAHRNSNATQDTRTLVSIDWSKWKVVAKTAVKVNKKATRKKAGKATVTITATKPKATGRVKVTLRIPGIKKAKVLTPKLNKQGKVVVKLPKAKKKGKYSVVVTYAGDKNYKAAKKKAASFKVK